jgi:hypothetical protein
MSVNCNAETIKICSVCGKDTKNKEFCVYGLVFRLCDNHALQTKNYIVKLIKELNKGVL